MIASPLAALVRCVRVTRRAVAPAPLTGLTMEQAARILAPRPRIVRRAVAIGCPAAVLPTAAVPPVVPLPVPPMPPALPLPYGIGTGPLLPPTWPAPHATPLPVQIADAAAAVPEPATLALLIVGIIAIAAVATTRRPEASHGAMQAPRGALTGMDLPNCPLRRVEWHGPAQRAHFGDAPTESHQPTTR